LHEDFLALDRVSLTQKQMKKNLDRDSVVSRVARFPQLRMRGLEIIYRRRAATTSRAPEFKTRPTI
jgi:hypothetical protein